jgi:AraC family transcriptional regulator of adaptative response/methylated-DNA-[protein]-cysteine methyltransferase
MKIRQLNSVSQLDFGFASTPFGECAIVFSEDGVSALVFHENRNAAIADLKNRFYDIELQENNAKAEQLCNQIFTDNYKLELCVRGTEFQRKVWSALCEIPSGSTTTYAQIAQKVGKPKAVRAVGTAIGANPVAWFIPCHRVLRSDGALGGFRWGLELKVKMLEREKEI